MQLQCNAEQMGVRPVNYIYKLSRRIGRMGLFPIPRRPRHGSVIQRDLLMAILVDFRRSGMTQVQFCQLRGISLHTFRPAGPCPAPRATASLFPEFLGVFYSY